MKSILKVQENDMLMGLNIHQGGAKLATSLEWWSVVSLKTRLKLPNTTFSKSN